MTYAMAAADDEYESPRTFSQPGHDAGLEPGETDLCSRQGAIALKAKIEAYWQARGLDVQISMQNVGFHPAIRAARYDVRSDMVNGLPRGARKPQR